MPGPDPTGSGSGIFVDPRDAPRPSPDMPRAPSTVAATLKLPLLLALLGAAAPAARGTAQVVTGRVVDGASGEPVDGAMVVLVDAGDRTANTTLTDAVGRFTLQAPGPGAYLLRADRIGFASAFSDTLRMAADDTVSHRMVTRFEPVALEGISVEGEKRCRVRPEEGAATARVWDEARKALSAAAWTQDARGYRYRLLSLERRLGPDGRDVRSERRRRASGFARNPISSRPAGELIEEGFARRLEDGDWMYYAPDAGVLLSDAFLDTHCMAVARGEDEREGLLGLRFRPVEGRRPPDIAGTLWMDPATSELQRLDFHYVNVERLLDGVSLNDRVGGEVVFRSLPNGSWIVQEWRIRMPLIARQGRPGEYRRAATLAGLHEIGGLVRQVRTEDGETVLSAEMGTLTGTVVDSTGTEPLAGATVRLEGTARSARTGADGRFRIGELGDGSYRVAYTHPSLESVGFRPGPRRVEVGRGGVTSIRFRAPSRAEALARSCRTRWEDEAPEDDAVGTLLGVVRTGPGGLPVEGARVEVLWSRWGFSALVEEGASGGNEARHYRIDEARWGAEARSDRNGFFSVCGVPRQQAVKAVAFRDSVPGDTVRTELEADHLRVELFVPASPPPSP